MLCYGFLCSQSYRVSHSFHFYRIFRVFFFLLLFFYSYAPNVAPSVFRMCDQIFMLYIVLGVFRYIFLFLSELNIISNLQVA